LEKDVEYYWRQALTPFGETSQVWKINENSAVLFGLTNPEMGAGTYFRAKPGETIWDAIRRDTPWFEPDGKSPFLPMDVMPGHFFPRIARPVDMQWATPPAQNPIGHDDANVIAISVGQLTALTRHLERIFQAVHPSDRNFEVYGHDIRNLLILACTEVEAHWRGILVANGVKDRKFRTQDYFSLKDALKLDKYSVAYPNYPWLPASSPFRDWAQEMPTQSLAWYDAYNATKHNREQAFELATLRHALDAVTACAILIMAQFGDVALSWKRSDTHSFFQFISLPSWAPNQAYFYSCETNGEWRAVHFKFRR
jgi:hypothetical protein